MTAPQSVPPTRPRLGLQAWEGLGTGLVNVLAWVVLAAYMFPMVYMAATAIKSDDQFRHVDAPPWPARQVTYIYEGREYAVYAVPTDSGVRQLALITKHRANSEFIDPVHPEQGLIQWQGYWGTLQTVYVPEYTLDNFVNIWKQADFIKALQNTIIITLLGGTGALVSSILVAYGFSRFPVPGGKWLFIILIAVIMLPDKVTLIPTYYIFTKILHWTGSWLPMIVPAFFGNAIMIFLLRQNFKSIPKEIEEAAVLDGANPLQVLTSIILPQARATVFTVALLQFFYFWNETREAALYLSTVPDQQPVSFWLQNYGSLFPSFNLLEASAILVMLVPVVVLFLSQGVFMRGVLVTGTEK